MPDALHLLQTRRSPSIMGLSMPAPSEEQLNEILTIAARVPDHGKLVPWRFIILSEQKRQSMRPHIEALFKQKNPEATAETIAAEGEKLLRAPTVIAVVFSPKESTKIPLWEQQLSCGACCQNLLLAAHALGFGAVWLTGWMVSEPKILEEFDVKPTEQIAAMMYIGTPTAEREDRPRPALQDIVTRL